MDLEFSAEQEDLRAAVRSVLERECPASLVRVMIESGAPDASLWATMTALDWPALTIPADCGGLGGDFVDLAVLAEELGRVMSPGPLLPTISQFAPVVREVGTADQRARFLRPVATGALTGTLALAESTWSLDEVTTNAQPGEGGWVLTGTKRHVIEGGLVDEVAVVARDTHGVLGVWVVPGRSMEAVPVSALDGSRRLATLVLDRVPVAADRRLGHPSAGGDVAGLLQRAVEEATTALAIEAVGTCQTIFDVALQYAKDRHQFGVPIGSFQAVKHKFANMTLTLERARATSYFAAACIAEDDPRRALATAMAKAAVGDCQQQLAQEGIQMLGGIGFTWEHDMHLYVKRAKTADALFGSARQHRAIVANLIGL
jgi:alkylation response protein AidB-like acyl-CoA dehydrogenase